MSVQALPAESTLHLHSVSSANEPQLDALMQSFKALKVIHIEKCSFHNSHSLIRLATKYHHRTLETIYFGEDQWVHGGNIDQLYSISFLSRLENIRHLTVCLRDVYNEADAVRAKSSADNMSPAAAGTGHTIGHLSSALAAVFLPSLEILELSMVWHDFRDLNNEGPTDRDLNTLDAALASVLQRKQTPRLCKLSLTQVEVEFGATILDMHYRYNAPGIFPQPVTSANIGHVVPHLRGHAVTKAGRATRMLCPAFEKVIEAGHSLGVVVETAHHFKSNCELCWAMPWTEQDKHNHAVLGRCEYWDI